MKSKRGLSVIAVCGLVLGIMAISASGAQAGKWMVNKANIATGVSLNGTMSATAEGGSITLLSTSGANSVAISCPTILVVVIMLATTLHIALIFHGCTTKINGTANAGCNPTNKPGIEANLTDEPVLHEGGKYVKALGVGGVFATLKFNEETCVALSPSIKLTGTGWLEDCNNEFETEKVTHLVQVAKVPAEKLGGLLFGGNKATIDGSVNLAFNDETHKGMTFSGLAE